MVQQEEARQPELADHVQLLRQARLRLGPRRVRLPVALVQARRAQLGQLALGIRILRPRVAVAEVVREVEGQPLGQRQRLAHRLGMVGETTHHRLRRGHHVAAVATAQRLGGVERRAVAQCHERVLQLGPAACMRMHVAAGHARHPEPPRERRQRAVAGAVVPRIGTLQLHAQVLRAERLEQAPCDRLVADAAADRRVPGAARQADEALRVVEHRLQRDRRLAPLALPRTVTGVCVGQREDPADVAPASPVAHQQREMAPAGTAAGGCGEIDLRAVDRPDPVVRRHLGQLHRARDRVVIGQRQRRVPELARAMSQLIGQRHAIQERVGRVAMQLDVRGRRRRGHRSAASLLAHVYAPWTNQPPARPSPTPAPRSWKTTMLRPLVVTTSQ